MHRLHHLAIAVTDLTRSAYFYEEVLGLPILRRQSDEGGALRAIWLAVDDGNFLALERTDAVGQRVANARGLRCVCLPIREDERIWWREHLATAGFPIERESPFTLYTRDPDANLVALSHLPSDQPNPLAP